jgi:small subunit ribosomal protein S17
MAENEENIAPEANEAAAPQSKSSRAHRSQKVGTVASDKMQKTVIVRVDRLVRHTKYRRYVRRTS